MDVLSSVTRNLALKMPYRACTLGVLNRGLPIHQWWRRHRQRRDERNANAFGSKRYMGQAFRDGMSKSNGFIELCAISHLNAVDDMPLWPDIYDDGRARCGASFSSRAKKRADIEELKTQLLGDPSSGPTSSR